MANLYPTELKKGKSTSPVDKLEQVDTSVETIELCNRSDDGCEDIEESQVFISAPETF